MNCKDADVNLLSSQDESSAEYLQYIVHLDRCPECQAQIENRLTADAITRELSQTLRSAEQSDLDFTTGVNTPTLQLEFETDYDEPLQANEHSQENSAVVHDLDFLQPATHPELLGRLGRYDIERVVGYGGSASERIAHS